MKGLMRMLMMFGPMIYRQYQKYQQNKSRQQASEKPNVDLDKEKRSNEHQDNNRKEIS